MSSALRNAIRAEMQFRAQRCRTIPSELLGEPAWDILLDLAISYLEGEHIQTTAAGLNAGLPPTTALRWIAQLAERGLVERVPDKDDGRRTWLELTRETMARIAACFGYEWEHERETALANAGDALALPAEDRPIFFTAQAEPAAQALARFAPAETTDGTTSKALLVKPATDWFDQNYAERLSLAAQALYVHGYLAPHEYRRIDQQLRDDIQEVRSKKMEARRENVERRG